MENDIQDRFDLINKRIDDNKNLISTLLTVASVVFATLGIIFSWDVGRDREELKVFKAELKKDVEVFLGKNSNEPDISLFTRAEEGLEKKNIRTKVELNKDGAPFIEIPIVLINDGQGPSGDITIKAYTDKNITMWDKASFENDFAYEAFWQGTVNTGIPDLPGGGYIHPYRFAIWPKEGHLVLPGTYPIKLKVYYGKNKSVSATFRITITENLMRDDV